MQWRSADLCGTFEQIETVVRSAEADLGPVDVLINNAGHSVQDAFEKLPVDSFEKQMRVNYLSAVRFISEYFASDTGVENQCSS